MLTFLMFLVISPIVFIVIISLPFQILKFLQTPKLNRNWFPLFEKLPSATVEKNGEVFFKNVRDATYNTNYEYECRVEYLNKKYSVNDLEKIWITVNPYATFQSHVILSFQFVHNVFLTFSYEIRKVDPTDFVASTLIFKNYEGHFIVATEEDAIFVRTNVRANYETTDIYLFPIIADKETVKQIFLDMVQEINLYSRKAFFYRVTYRSCVTEIFKYLKKFGVVKYHINFELRNILELLYKNNCVSGAENLSYSQFKKKYFITDKAKNLKHDENFSLEIRRNL